MPTGPGVRRGARTEWMAQDGFGSAGRPRRRRVERTPTTSPTSPGPPWRHRRGQCVRDARAVRMNASGIHCGTGPGSGIPAGSRAPAQVRRRPARRSAASGWPASTAFRSQTWAFSWSRGSRTADQEGGCLSRPLRRHAEARSPPPRGNPSPRAAGPRRCCRPVAGCHSAPQPLLGFVEGSTPCQQEAEQYHAVGAASDSGRRAQISAPAGWVALAWDIGSLAVSGRVDRGLGTESGHIGVAAGPLGHKGRSA